jgi:hypothetical protein
MLEDYLHSTATGAGLTFSCACKGCPVKWEIFIREGGDFNLNVNIDISEENHLHQKNGTKRLPRNAAKFVKEYHRLPILVLFQQLKKKNMCFLNSNVRKLKTLISKFSNRDLW